ncbi:MAG TPA: secondary thiamine-phosphate synthase enzyme YjbQ [Ktedonobacteraceae bacterium]|jgi:secondary thiamine-phosphate synthase enzyme|nr:secondary thiamine-phosphate synthase enzyme YjbQ [Ktedonobacteraceae bacterium]
MASMKSLTVSTRKKDQVLDITDRVEAFLREEQAESGACVVFSAHTTCAITTADLDPGTDLDLLDALRGVLPNIRYRHPHDPAHTPDHILASLIGPSITVPYVNGQLLLGVWQRIILVEFDGPRQRDVHLTLL